MTDLRCNILIIIIVVSIDVIVGRGVNAQQLKGLPFIQNYPAKVYKQDPQNWSIVQDKRGVMYFGNTSGLLEYDGTRWRILKVKNSSAVRSVCIGNDNKLYIGASSDFGYLEIGNSGNYTYKSLSERLDKIDFTSVWKVYFTSHGVYYFAGRSSIYKYYNDSLIKIIINPEIRDFRGFCIDDKIFAIDSKYGICKIENDTLIENNIAVDVASKQVYVFLKVADSKFLMGTRNDGLYIYDTSVQGSVKSTYRFNSQADRYFKNNKIYYGILLKNKNIAIATLQGGLIIINQFGELVTILNKSKGLLADDIYYLYSDRNDNLWIGQERGISKVEINSAFTQFNAINGIEGTLLSGIIYNNHLYLGTSIGIYHLLDFNLNTASKAQNIIPLTKKYNYVLDFCTLDNPYFDKQILLSSTLRNIIRIKDDNSIEEIIPLYGCYKIQPSYRIKNRIFLAHPNGISSVLVNFSKTDSHKISYTNEGQIADIKDNIRLLTIDKYGDLWISTAFNGIIYLRFYDEENLNDYEYYRYNVDNGLPQNNGNSVYNINNKIVVTTEKGLYKINNPDLLNSNPKQLHFIPDTSFQFNYMKDSINITSLKEDKNNNIWFGTNQGVFKYLNHDGINNELLSYPMKRITGLEIEKIFIEDNGIPWFSTKEALFRYNFNNRSKFFPNYYALIRTVRTRDSVLFYGNDPDLYSKEKYDGQEITLSNSLDYNHNSVYFEYTAPSYENEEANVYKVKLEGFNNEWSGWTKEIKKEYTNLSEGKYTFKVKAKNIFGVESVEAKYSFLITPPWYRTLFAFILYGVGFISLSFFGMEAYSKSLRHANIRLEKIILNRTSEIENQKEKIQEQSEKLLIANKELEKLSIVAEQTDNAIVIMDPKGNFEWINEGFTRLYGYTFKQLIKEKDRNIIGASSNLNIKDLINVWFGDKKAIIYESLNTTLSGKKIWAQTTLTPIINEKGRIEKLIAIDSDITKLKEAEEQIEMQRDEIKAQRDMAISQRDEISQQKKEITDSIIYAKRIQRALLPSTELIDKILQNYFILYKPRDIVSGDFYWITRIKNKIIIAAADCTGHGVPGAFMSLIGISFLNEIVNGKNVTKASEILNQLREYIILSLQHSREDDEARDGMDMALCIIDNESKTMEYASANNPIFLIRKKKLIELKPDKMPIGRHRLSNVPFKNNRVEINNGDLIYLFTDGYIDQFGGLNDKKFKSHNFKKLLVEIQDEPIKKQKSILDNKFEEWRGNAEQVDDILVIGFKIEE